MTTESGMRLRARAQHRFSPPGTEGFALVGAPEFRLLAACCRWPPSESRNAAIRSAAAAKIDWKNILAQARRQRISGLLHEALLSATPVACPPIVTDELGWRAQRIIRKNIISAGETVRLCRALEVAGIPVLVLKGASLAMIAYGLLGIKQARDIDLLVPPDCAQAAIQLLEREDYVLVSPARSLSTEQRSTLIQYGREVELTRRDTKIQVELQWRITNNVHLLKGVDARSETQEVRLYEGASVRTLALSDLFAALCVHGAVHAWSRMKWLADLNALISTSNADVEKLYRHAQAIGAGLCAGQALLLCLDLFDLRIPESLASEIRTDKRIKNLVSIALAAMSEPKPRTDPARGVVRTAHNYYDEFLLGKGWNYFLAECRVVAVGPADVIRWPLPRGLHFLYPLLRLPLLLWRRGTSALRRAA